MVDGFPFLPFAVVNNNTNLGASKKKSTSGQKFLSFHKVPFPPILKAQSERR